MVRLAVDPEELFDQVVAGDVGVDRHDVYSRLRDDRPIFFSAALDSWVLTRYDDVKAVLEDEERFWVLTEGRGAPVFGRSLLQWRGREHNKKAGPVVKRIRSPRAFSEGVDEMVRRVTVSVADGLEMETPVDLKATYTMWMPLLVITELLDIHEGRKFRAWYHAIVQGGVTSISRPELREAAFAALGELKELLEPIVEERRVRPGSDVVSDLAVATYDGEPFPFHEILSTVAFLLAAGVETTERALASLFRHYALERGQWEDVRAHRDDQNLLQSIAAESLRYFPPVQALPRRVESGAEFHGTTVGHDERVVIFLVSANRDEEHFPDGQRFDAERWLDHPERQFVAGGKILPFGSGRHHCAGSRLAATEMVHGIRELAERVAWLEPDGELPVGEGLMLNSPTRVPVILHAAA